MALDLNFFNGLFTVAFVLVILKTRETACAFRKSKAKRYLEDVLAYIQAPPFMQICGGVGRTAQATNQHSNGLLNLPDLSLICFYLVTLKYDLQFITMCSPC